MMLQNQCFHIIETLNEVEGDTEVIETSNQNNQMQYIESFKTNPYSLKLDHKKLR